jgi:hypothetical protein
MQELIKIQSELKAPKNQMNNFGGYKYRSCEDILKAVKPLLKDLKCYLNISDKVVALSDRFYVKATATLVNSAGVSVSATAYAREPLTKKGMDEAQITGATSSYARKYALNGLFSIDDTKDADANNKHEDDIRVDKGVATTQAKPPKTAQDTPNSSEKAQPATQQPKTTKPAEKGKNDEIEICHFGKDASRAWADMELERLEWYANNYFPAKIANGGAFAEKNKQVLEHIKSVMAKKAGGSNE